MTEDQANQTLRTGNYTIELSDGPSAVYKIEPTSGVKEWVCTCPDPEAAMTVVEGLILVENKRYYYPDSKPNLTFEEAKEKKETPDLLKGEDDSCD